MKILRLLPILGLMIAGCTAGGASDGSAAQASAGLPFAIEPLATFDEPWAMVFLPGGRGALVTEKGGRLKLWRADGAISEVVGVPRVAYGGQAGLGDVVLDPGFADNNLVWLSWVEQGEGGFGAVVGRATLAVNDGAARLEGVQIVWRQTPKVSGRGHFAHRLAFSPDGRHLFISSGEREKFTPAQDLNANLGKIIRLNRDGSIPADNPFASRGGIAAQVWTLGHRNPLGIAFAPDGRFWSVEMGPAGGDELNLIERGRNYGYPIVSDGDHYDGRPIPDHRTRPEFAAPLIAWTPVISPGDMIIYTGNLFPSWRGDALIAALSGEALVHVDIEGARAREHRRFPMNARIREVEQGPDGAVYLLEDGERGRLLRLTPRT